MHPSCRSASLRTYYIRAKTSKFTLVFATPLGFHTKSVHTKERNLALQSGVKLYSIFNSSSTSETCEAEAVKETGMEFSSVSSQLLKCACSVHFQLRMRISAAVMSAVQVGSALLPKTERDDRPHLGLGLFLPFFSRGTEGGGLYIIPHEQSEK